MFDKDTIIKIYCFKRVIDNYMIKIAFQVKYYSSINSIDHGRQL